MKLNGNQYVVTWNTPRGNKLNICNPCALKFKRDQSWPRHANTGEEYCQVYHGQHKGQCDCCKAKGQP